MDEDKKMSCSSVWAGDAMVQAGTDGDRRAEAEAKCGDRECFFFYIDVEIVNV